MGVRFQCSPNEEHNEIVLHVRMLDKHRLQQQQALGILGVNLLHCAFYHSDSPENFIRLLADNIKEDRTSEDLLFQVMLDLGVTLSSKIEQKTIAGKKVFYVEEKYLIAYFDDDVTEEVITEIAKQEPYYFVMRDSSMANDSVATNFEQIFATYSPGTVRKVL